MRREDAKWYHFESVGRVYKIFTQLIDRVSSSYIRRQKSKRALKVDSIRPEIFRHQGIEDRFTEIYRRNWWGSKETVSGDGATLRNTKNIRKQLPELLKIFSVKSIFDAPCGDFNWMRKVVRGGQFHYVGGDIVAPLIQSNNQKYQNTNTRFIHIDLTKETFPSADLMICRAFLYHLSYGDTKAVLRNFVASKIDYLLTTNYINSDGFLNTDIKTGDFRPIDLFSAPYYFPKNVLYRIDDGFKKVVEIEMCLFSKEQIVSVIEKFN